MSELLRNDVDPGETREWLDALESLLREEGPDRARFILDQLADKARHAGVEFAIGGKGGQILTDYINSIATSDEPAYPGNAEIELRIQAYQGLHDIVFVPYFSGEESWKTIGYPGPRAV